MVTFLPLSFGINCGPCFIAFVVVVVFSSSSVMLPSRTATSAYTWPLPGRGMVIYSFSLWQQQLCFFFTKQIRAIKPITRRCIFIIFFTRLHSIVYFTYQYMCLKTIKRWPFHGSLVWPATAFINNYLYIQSARSFMLSLPNSVVSLRAIKQLFMYGAYDRGAKGMPLSTSSFQLTLSPPFTNSLHAISCRVR